MKYWLMKSEPDVYSIDHLQKERFANWEGVRNYQARNYMRDQMHIGDLALFYHSNAHPSGVAGLCRISKEAFPDDSAWNPKSQYFDPKTKKDKPTWMMVQVEFVEKFSHFVSLQEMKERPEFKNMLVVQKGIRLSIQPVSKDDFELICLRGR